MPDKENNKIISLTFSNGAWRWKPKQTNAKHPSAPSHDGKVGQNVISQDHLARKESELGTPSLYRGHFLNGLI